MLTLLMALGANAAPAGPRAEVCSAPTSRVDLEATLESAEVAFGELRITDFLTATDDLQTTVLPCQTETLDVALAARIHRVLGLRAFGERDVYAVQAFAASRALEPEYVFPSTLVADVSPIRDDFGAMSLDARRNTEVLEPVEGALWFDGRPALVRPSAWGTVFQRVDAAGTVAHSTYLRPDDPLPAYEAVAPAPQSVVGSPEARRRLLGDASPGLFVGAVGAAAAGIGLFAAAGATHAKWADPQTDPARLDGLRDRNNGLLVGAGAAGVAALGMGIGVGLQW